MKRRQFLRGLASAAVGGGLANASWAASEPAPEELDRFGGWKVRKFRATGYFRVEKDDRWWLVTPEGNAFLSFGINHLHPGWWAQPYNREAWQKRLGVPELRGSAFHRAFRAWFMREHRQFGFNTIGVHNSLEVLNVPAPFMPYMRSIHFVRIPHWQTRVPDSAFVDIFSDSFARHCDNLARVQAAPLAKDPFLLGYAMTDCPLFTEEDCRARTDVIGGKRRGARITWPRKLRNLGADAPGKRAYVDTMRKLYRDEIHDFNATYGTRFDSFDGLAQARDWRPMTDLSNGFETRDNVEFLKRVVAKYYQTARDAIRRHDPNHLFFGDKLNANTDTVDTVLPVTSRFTDVVFYQMYAKFGVQEPGMNRWSRVAGRPLVNGDSSFVAMTEMAPRPFGPVAYDQDQRAEWAREFFERAFARPDFVGWHYCGLIDTWKAGGVGGYFEREDEFGPSAGRQHTGLLRADGEPYEPIQRALRESTEKLYRIATGEV